jgi:hypothetical protein
MQPTKVTSILSSVGALAGIYYGVKGQKGFWATAGYALLFSIAGAAAGSAIGAAQGK